MAANSTAKSVKPDLSSSIDCRLAKPVRFLRMTATIGENRMQEKSALAFQLNVPLLLFAGAVLLYLSCYFWIAILFDDGLDADIEFMYWVAALYFPINLACYTIISWRHWGAIFRVTAEGIHDVRITNNIVPWDEIEALSLKKGFFVTKIRATLKPGIARKEFGTPCRMSLLIPNFGRSASSLDVATGLNCKPPDILDCISRYSHFPSSLRTENE